jgi:glutamate N-acetyltransferase/amino-acid N-acetyltransferase
MDIEPDRVAVRFGELTVYPGGVAASADQLERLRAIMGADEVEIGIDLGIADGAWTVYGCDLTCCYVRVNADYTT